MRMCTWIGAHPGHRGADRDARHGVLGQRRAEDALRPEFLDEAAGRTLDCLVIVNVEAEDEDTWIARHLLRGRLAQRVDIGQQAHGYCSAKTLV